MIVITEQSDDRLILDIAITFEYNSVCSLALGKVLWLNFNFKAAKQVLEDVCPDNAAFHVIDLATGLNYLLLLAIEVVIHHTGGDAAHLTGPRHHRDAVCTHQSRRFG